MPYLEYLPLNLLLIGIHVVVVLAWGKAYGYKWTVFAMSSVVFTVVNVISPQLDTLLSFSFNSAAGIIANNAYSFIVIRIIQWLVRDAFKEGVKWFLFRYVSLDWKDTVAFGILYSVILSAVTLTRGYIDDGTFPSISLTAVWHIGILVTVYNVGISLLVMRSANQGKARFFVIAVILSVVFHTTPIYLLVYHSGHSMADILFTLSTTIAVIPLVAAIAAIYFLERKGKMSKI